MRLIGPAGSWLIRGLLDPGASMTLLPRSFMSKLGMVPGERARLATAAGGAQHPTRLARPGIAVEPVGLPLVGAGRVRPRADNLALLGHTGFLDHFAVTFDGLRKRVTLRPNGTFPPPAVEVG